VAALIVTHAPDQLTDVDRHLHLHGGRVEARDVAGSV
jgi:hypothetical protein